jgi:hypothetical protein
MQEVECFFSKINIQSWGMNPVLTEQLYNNWTALTKHIDYSVSPVTHHCLMKPTTVQMNVVILLVRDFSSQPRGIS